MIDIPERDTGSVGVMIISNGVDGAEEVAKLVSQVQASLDMSKMSCMQQ